MIRPETRQAETREAWAAITSLLTLTETRRLSSYFNPLADMVEYGELSLRDARYLAWVRWMYLTHRMTEWPQ